MLEATCHLQKKNMEILMKPLKTIVVEPNLPEALSGLLKLAYNLWWAWHGEAQNLFRRLDPDLWEQVNHNPVALLGQISQTRLSEAAEDDAYLAHLERVESELDRYLSRPGWCTKEHNPCCATPNIAYFSAEFGISESLPIYSGGLGVLAGDHLKSASDLGVPLVGVGMLYQQGYFHQRLNADGWQLELTPRNDFHNLPVTQVMNFTDNNIPLVIDVQYPGRVVKAYVWQVNVGRIKLFLLDTNVPENTPEDRQITNQLYGGDHEMRIKQEVLLGIGGVHMLRALGLDPQCYHMNEGHSAFLSLERIRHAMWTNKVSFEEACEAVIPSNVFTTHTPVPAGNDAFGHHLIVKYLGDYIKHFGLSESAFLNLGREESPDSTDPFNMTIFAIRMSRFRNGVSQLHAKVSRGMWRDVFPSVPVEEVPIDGLVNGVHTSTWISHDMAGLYDRYLGPRWSEQPSDTEIWQRASKIPDEELWRTHERRRERTIAFTRKRLQACARKRGASQTEIKAASEVLDPEALTIGFARRFATYKRAELLFADLDRLERILSQPGRKVQFLFAGKAHPKDTPGKELIRKIVHISRQPRFAKSIVFIEDYDMNVARYMVQGVDVWLNTPLRPLEASGTSGMKVAANGGLNLSILDGWWDEGYDPSHGWAIGAGEHYDDYDYQNEVESCAIYDLLENEVVPTFYDRGSDTLPRKWVAMMKQAVCQLAPMFNSNRMVRQYIETCYLPASANCTTFGENDLTVAKDLAHWKHHIKATFSKIRILSVKDTTTPDMPSRVGVPIEVHVELTAGDLTEADLVVEVVAGRILDNGEMTFARGFPMEFQGATKKGHLLYSASTPPNRTGRFGYTVRVCPAKDSKTDPSMNALIRWA